MAQKIRYVCEAERYNEKKGRKMTRKTVTLNQNRDFRRIYHKGKTAVNPILVTYLVKTRRDENRMGITASKKIGKAYVRNRAKRLIREAYRQIEPGLPIGLDLIFVARSRTAGAKMQQVQEVMLRQLQKILSQ